VVGHSLGGVYARVFAARHVTEIEALVFVDAFWPDIHTTGLDLPEAFLQLSREDTAATAASIEAAEDLDWRASLGQLAATGPLAMPVEILAVDQRFRYDDRWFTRAQEDIAIADWERQLSALFPRGRITIVEGSGHVIQIDRPEAVVAAIRRRVEGALAATQLPGPAIHQPG
jgi:pimeloyl-ACP methyl ester carboxylesterase